MSINNFPLVSVVNGEPLASSLVIAKGMKTSHRNVIQLVRKYLAELRSFGLVTFEMRPRLKGSHGGGDVEFALLNERQAALLITMMRNTDEVVAFKVNLIREFYRMRDALNQREENLYQQLQAVIAEEVSTQIKASFGSHLMLERKRAIPLLREKRERIESELQPSLELH